MNKHYTVIEPGDSRYPGRLKDIWGRGKEPPALYALGNLSLLERPAIGICGSRKATAEALELALELGKVIAEGGRAVVTGLARGIDRQAYNGALQAGGDTIAVLSEGFSERIGSCKANRELSHLREQGLEDNFLAISMFAPGAHWQAWRAMERNQLVVGLAASLVVVEAQEKGGTMDAAQKCIRQGKKLWVVDYPETMAERAGNELLLKKSATTPLNFADNLERALTVAETEPAGKTEQLALGVEV